MWRIHGFCIMYSFLCEINTKVPENVIVARNAWLIGGKMDEAAHACYCEIIIHNRISVAGDRALVTEMSALTSTISYFTMPLKREKKELICSLFFSPPFSILYKITAS